jgi:hypothetical protein
VGVVVTGAMTGPQGLTGAGRTARAGGPGQGPSRAHPRLARYGHSRWVGRRWGGVERSGDGEEGK